MTNDLSIVHLITEASLIVQLVMLILFIASVVSWGFIRNKHKELKHTLKTIEDFEERFWEVGDLSKLYQDLTENNKQL